MVADDDDGLLYTTTGRCAGDSGCDIVADVSGNDVIGTYWSAQDATSGVSGPLSRGTQRSVQERRPCVRRLLYLWSSGELRSHLPLLLSWRAWRCTLLSPSSVLNDSSPHCSISRHIRTYPNVSLSKLNNVFRLRFGQKTEQVSARDHFAEHAIRNWNVRTWFYPPECGLVFIFCPVLFFDVLFIFIRATNCVVLSDIDYRHASTEFRL